MTILTFGELKVADGRVNKFIVGGYGKTNLEALEVMFKEVYKLMELHLI
jgi:hypothetical protein